MKKIILCLLTVAPHINLFANKIEKDSTDLKPKDSFISKVPYKELIAPSALMSYGIIALESHSLLKNNQEINEEIREHASRKLTIDNFTQHLPTVTVFILPTFRIKPTHPLKFRAISSLIANSIMMASVLTIKETGNVWRPDHSSNNSFPSGHTATAFVGAEQLWQEYKDESIWYGIGVYSIAAGTGFFRMYNNRHWFSDVAMGAGIGILSTKIAYWITPLIVHENTIKSRNIYFAPNYQKHKIGFMAHINF